MTGGLDGDKIEIEIFVRIERGMMMKFLHLGDLHIGKIVNECNMLSNGDQPYMLEQLLKYMVENKVDAVLIAGDLYDSSTPSDKAKEFVSNFFVKLQKNNIKAFVISGNHDSDIMVQYGQHFFRDGGIYLTGDYDGTVKKETVEDEFGHVNIYMLPYVKASHVAHYFPEEEIGRDYNKAVGVALSNCNVDKKQRNIILSHQFVAGKAKLELSGSEQQYINMKYYMENHESADAVNVGTIDMIDINLYNDFDYVALGHIHSSQKVGRETARYSGSLLKYSKSEAVRGKKFPVITMEEKGKISIEYAEIKPLRDMRVVRGAFSDIIKNDKSEDYVFVELTDKDKIDDVRNTLKTHVYPNMMSVEYYRPEQSATSTELPAHEYIEEKSFREIITDFYSYVHGKDITEKELAILEELAREAGIKNA